MKSAQDLEEKEKIDRMIGTSEWSRYCPGVLGTCTKYNCQYDIAKCIDGMADNWNGRCAYEWDGWEKLN